MTWESTTSLPPPVRRWLSTAWNDDPPEIDSVVYTGHARLRRPGTPWIGVSARFANRLGRERVCDFRLGIGPVTLLRVLDAYVDGRGISRMGRRADLGPGTDQGAFLALVGESLPYPSAWRHLPDLRFEGVDESTVRVHVRLGEAELSPLWSFDPAGMPVRLEVDRHKGADGPLTPWRAESLDWGRFGGVPAPRRFVVTWLDEPGPWFEMRIDRVDADLPLDADVARARTVLARAGGFA